MPGFKPKAAARSADKPGGKTTGKPGGKLHGAGNCGTGKGGFKPGNVCGKGGRAKMAAHLRAARSAAKAPEDARAVRLAARELRHHRRGKDGAVDKATAQAHAQAIRSAKPPAIQPKAAGPIFGGNGPAHIKAINSLPEDIRPAKAGAMKTDARLSNDELKMFRKQYPDAQVTHVPITPAIRAKLEGHLDAWRRSGGVDVDKLKSVLGADTLPPSIIRTYSSERVGIPDGFHRSVAHMLAGHKTIPAYHLGEDGQPVAPGSGTTGHGKPPAIQPKAKSSTKPKATAAPIP